jgi:hypothetical protein
MAASRSDALVLFGVTGDLAHKMIFPALYAMAKRGTLKVPVIGVASPNWSLARLRARVTDSLRRSGGVDNKRALHQLLSRLSYVSGAYRDAGTFAAIGRALGTARRPAHYLAIPPSLFGTAESANVTDCSRRDGTRHGTRRECLRLHSDQDTRGELGAQHAAASTFGTAAGHPVVFSSRCTSRALVTPLHQQARSVQMKTRRAMHQEPARGRLDLHRAVHAASRASGTDFRPEHIDRFDHGRVRE